MNFLDKLEPSAKRMALALLTARNSTEPVENLNDSQLTELLANGGLSHIFIWLHVDESKYRGENYVMLEDPLNRFADAGIDIGERGRVDLAKGALELARVCKEIQPDRPWLKEYVK